MSSLIVEAVRIKEIQKHPNADRLEIAQVKGWNVIIQSGQYKVDDLVVFVPPDSILPQTLIEKYNIEYMKSGERIRTVKLRGFVSQGLILPLPSNKCREGDDLSSVLGITKWQSPEPSYSVRGGNMISKKKSNPLFDKYTDIENIKNYSNVFVEGDDVVMTEKIHGCNSRYGNLPILLNDNATIIEKLSVWWKVNILRKTHEFVWGSHNVQKGVSVARQHFYGEDVWGKIAEKYNLSEIIPNDYIVYGEIVGEGIQDLTYGFKNHELFVFDIKVKGQYMNWVDLVYFCENNGLKTVPYIYSGVYYDGLLKDYTDGKSLICPSQIREGIVVKSCVETNHRAIGRKILKSISVDYLTRKNGSEYK